MPLPYEWTAKPVTEPEKPAQPGPSDPTPVARSLLALNFGVFMAEVVLSRSFVPTPGVKMQLGASYALATLGEGRWETLVTACFLHADVVHVAFNMALLWLAGPLVERTVGSARMAPLYLVAGVFGNLVSVATTSLVHGASYGTFLVGASGAISGVFAAAMVVGFRVQGWRGPLTQAMARWLAFVLVFGFLSTLRGGSSDNAAHVGGALAGGAIAAGWQLRYRYSAAATRAVLLACAGLVVACVAVLSIREATDRFATMMLSERWDYTMRAATGGRCRDAHDGLLAVERLRGPMESLRKPVEMTCGHLNDR